MSNKNVEKNGIAVAKYCPKCGKPTINEGDYCVYCGARMDDGAWNGPRGAKILVYMDPPVYEAVCQNAPCGHIYNARDLYDSSTIRRQKRFCPQCGGKCEIRKIPRTTNRK